VRDKFVITCSEVKDKLKPFLEDMLAEEEYQAFVVHIESCPKCRDYVRSISALSNQLWKLGDIEVPSDFVSTVIFNLKHPTPAVPPAAKPAIFKRRAVVIAVSILIASTLFLGIAYFKKFKVSQKVSEAPIITKQIITEQKPPSDQEAAMFLEELKEIKEALGPSQKDEIAEKPPAVTVPSASKEASIVMPNPLHWHFLYTEEAEKRKLLDALNSLSIIPEHKTQDLIIFNATGEKIDKVIEQAISSSKQNIPLRDFTTGAPISKDKESRVTLYFDNVKTQIANVLHWHVVLMSTQQKDKLLEIIQSIGGSIDYESEELFVFSIPKTEIKKLKKRIQVMGFIFTEFGKLELKEGQLSSIPVKVSIYFSKGRL